jgi:hypothetical protein
MDLFVIIQVIEKKAFAFNPALVIARLSFIGMAL